MRDERYDQSVGDRTPDGSLVEKVNGHEHDGREDQRSHEGIRLNCVSTGRRQRHPRRNSQDVLGEKLEQQEADEKPTKPPD